MTNIASTPAHQSDDFERAARQALRLVSPARLRLISTRPRPAAKSVPCEDIDLEVLAVSVGILSPVRQAARLR
ncbi:hypothetical protein AB0D34_12395 [Streptomyces sp. NPDC048420]|uniref:hypothetical protein n=1 Tax=Streptomyces sp. NPDC048420 TaxID=3155755 RepID=UPI003427CB10